MKRCTICDRWISDEANVVAMAMAEETIRRAGEVEGDRFMAILDLWPSHLMVSGEENLWVSETLTETYVVCVPCQVRILEMVIEAEVQKPYQVGFVVRVSVCEVRAKEVNGKLSFDPEFEEVVIDEDVVKELYRQESSAVQQMKRYCE